MERKFDRLSLKSFLRNRLRAEKLYALRDEPGACQCTVTNLVMVNLVRPAWILAPTVTLETKSLAVVQRHVRAIHICHSHEYLSSRERRMPRPPPPLLYPGLLWGVHRVSANIRQPFLRCFLTFAVLWAIKNCMQFYNFHFPLWPGNAGSCKLT